MYGVQEWHHGVPLLSTLALWDRVRLPEIPPTVEHVDEQEVELPPSTPRNPVNMALREMRSYAPTPSIK